MRYIIQPSESPNYWVCTDQENGLVCKFEQGNFNIAQEFTFLEDTKLSAIEIASAVGEMGYWLAENHRDKI